MFYCGLHTSFLQVPFLPIFSKLKSVFHSHRLQPCGTKLLRDELDGPHNDKCVLNYTLNPNHVSLSKALPPCRHGHYEPSFHIELVYSLKSC